MATGYVTLIDHEFGRECEQSVKSFMVEKDQHPRIGLTLCAAFAAKSSARLNLRVLAHGMESRLPDLPGDYPTDGKVVGGFGVKFGGTFYGPESLREAFVAVRGSFDEIVFLCCKLAEVSGQGIVADNPGNGPELCRKLAFATNTAIVASDDTQTAVMSGIPSKKPVGLTPWVGNVWRFPRTGGPGELIQAADRDADGQLRPSNPHDFKGS